MLEDGISLLREDDAYLTKLSSSEKLRSCSEKEPITHIEVLHRGCRISGNGRCLGWRSSNVNYSWLTYQEFMTRAMNFGSGLMKMGADLGQSTLVGIYSQTALEWVIAQYGCYYYSSPIVPLYDTLGSDACTYMINHGAIKVIICDKENKVKNLLDRKEDMPTLKHIVCVSYITDSVKELAILKGVCMHSFEDIEVMGQVNRVAPRLPKPTDVAEICYTSGTTGNPKGAILTHEGIISTVQGTIKLLDHIVIDQTDTMIAYLPLAHIFEQFLECMIFLTGGSLGFFGGNIASLLDDIKLLKPTFFPAVPRLLNKLFDKAEAELNTEKLKMLEINSSEDKKFENELDDQFWDPNLYKSFRESLGGKIKLIVSGAAPISDSVLKFYRRVLKCNVVELYGQTETSGPCTGNIVTDTSFGHVGTPLDCFKIKLVDVPELRYYSCNNTGELCVKGVSVFKSYLKDPNLTAEAKDVDGWLHTGDIALKLSCGAYKIIDRKKHIFKLSQGEYVAPEKLENIFLQSPYISQILVHGDSFQNYIVAVVIPNDAVVMSWCKENIKCSSILEACENPAVKQLILEDLRRIAKKAKILPFEEVKKIHLHPKLLTSEDGFLTPTGKTKRTACLNFFEKELQNLYCENLEQCSILIK